MNAVTTTSPAETFRATAATSLVTAAGMNLHELVDEYLRLTKVIEANTVKPLEGEDDWGGRKLNDAGKLAARERGIIDGAAKVRFGITFDEYDRTF